MHKGITQQYILSLFSQELEQKEQSSDTSSIPQYARSPLFNWYMRLPTFIRNPIRIYFFGKEHVNQIGKFHEVSHWDYNFMHYALTHKINIDSKTYPPKDMKEADRFVRNKIRMVVQHKIPKDSGESSVDKEYVKKYKQFAKSIKQTSNGYTFSYNGKSWTFQQPVQSELFVHGYGLEVVPKQVQKKVEGKSIFDCGAYVGEATAIFDALTPQNIFCFEPIQETYRRLAKNLRTNGMHHCTAVKKGVGPRDETVHMIEDDHSSRVTSTNKGGVGIEVTSLDTFATKNKVSCGLIKLDIEGLEFGALQGAKKIIKKDKPILLISAYHTGKDFFEIPKLIKNIQPKYTLRFVNANRKHLTDSRLIIAYCE